MHTKKLRWLGDSQENLREFPSKVKRDIGHALWRTQQEKTPYNAKPLKGFSHGVMEIKSTFDTNTYRAVYVLKLGDSIYVLHCFQKKSKSGIKTAQQDINLIKQRLNFAKRLSKET